MQASGLATVVSFAMGMATQPAKPIRTAYFSIETGSSTGSNFAAGSALATVLSHPPGSLRCQIEPACGPPGLIAVAVTSTGAVASARDVSLGRVESALVPANIAAAAFRGTDSFKADKPHTNLRAIARLYPEVLHIVVPRGKLRSVADLKGKTIAVDGSGTPTNMASLAVLAAANIPRKAVNLSKADAEAAVDLLVARRIDGFFVLAPTPSPAVTRAAARMQIDLVPIVPQTAKRLARDVYLPQQLPASVYAGVPSTPTVSVGMLWLVAANKDPQLIRQLAAALWDPSNAGFFSGSRDIRQAVLGMPIPLHPGAERFYRDQGILPTERAENAAPM